MKRKLLNAALMARAKASLTLADGPFSFLSKAPTAGAEKRSWFNIVRSAEADEVDVLIYDEIGWYGVNASDFVKALAEVDAAQINLRVNSPGGSVFDGIAIYQALAAHPAKIVAYVDGWAASIASVIIMAADKILIGEAAQVMIHRPWSFVMGPADDMRKEADVLDSIQEAIIDVYVARTGGERAAITEQVVAETWFKGQAAVDAGFADELVPLKLKSPAKPAASLDAGFFATIFPNLPEDIRGRLPGTAEADASFNFGTATPREAEAFLRAHGASRKQAADAVNTHFKTARARDESGANSTDVPARDEQPNASAPRDEDVKAIKDFTAATAIRLAASLKA